MQAKNNQLRVERLCYPEIDCMNFWVIGNDMRHHPICDNLSRLQMVSKQAIIPEAPVQNPVVLPEQAVWADNLQNPVVQVRLSALSDLDHCPCFHLCSLPLSLSCWMFARLSYRLHCPAQGQCLSYKGRLSRMKLQE